MSERKKGHVRVGKWVAGTEAELSDPASAQAPEKASLKPRRHWEWPGGESRRWVGAGLLFIQTREEEMNNFVLLCFWNNPKLMMLEVDKTGGKRICECVFVFFK